MYIIYVYKFIHFPFFSAKKTSAYGASDVRLRLPKEQALAPKNSGTKIMILERFWLIIRNDRLSIRGTYNKKLSAFSILQIFLEYFN